MGDCFHAFSFKRLVLRRRRFDEKNLIPTPGKIGWTRILDGLEAKLPPHFHVTKNLGSLLHRQEHTCFQLGRSSKV